MESLRPSPLIIDEDAPMREDIRSEEVDLVLPEMARLATAKERNEFLKKCDKEAWKEHIRSR